MVAENALKIVLLDSLVHFNVQKINLQANL